MKPIFRNINKILTFHLFYDKSSHTRSTGLWPQNRKPGFSILKSKTGSVLYSLILATLKIPDADDTEENVRSDDESSL